MTTSAIVLAGGLGTRLRSVVEDVPKPMARVGERPFLEWLLDYWIDRGITSFVLAVSYRAETIRAHFGERYRSASISYAIEETPLGTGGGLLRAAALLDAHEPFLVLNGDTYFAVERSELDAFADATDADWCFSLFRTEEGGRYMGMHVEENGRIRSLRSNSAEPGRWANGGVYRVHPRALAPFDSLRERVVSLENDIFPRAVEMGQRIFGFTSERPFIDIGLPDDYARAVHVLMGAT